MRSKMEILDNGYIWLAIKNSDNEDEIFEFAVKIDWLMALLKTFSYNIREELISKFLN